MVPLDVTVNILAIRHEEDAKELKRLDALARERAECSRAFHMRCCALDTELMRTRDLLARANDKIDSLKKKLRKQNGAHKKEKSVRVEL